MRQRSGLCRRQDIVHANPGIAGKDRYALHLTLRYEQTVERVTVVHGETKNSHRMTDSHLHRFDMVAVEVRCQEGIGGALQRQLPDLRLDRHFPSAGRAEIQGVPGIGYDLARRQREPGIVGNPPQEDVRIKEV